MSDIVPQDPWSALRQHTAARIGLGRAGAAIPTGETLQFKLAHARARDAVHSIFDPLSLAKKIIVLHSPVMVLQSRARDRSEYLRRPDLGRRLCPESISQLEGLLPVEPPGYDLALVVTDGLSPLAIQRHAEPLLTRFFPHITANTVAPLCIVERGRVAIGDEIGHHLRARLVIVLIGERPGLSSPDSMGIYLTHHPRLGLTDESRNCLSNIRPGGLGYAGGAEKLAWLVRESLKRQLSGVHLKEEAPPSLPGDSALFFS